MFAGIIVVASAGIFPEGFTKDGETEERIPMTLVAKLPRSGVPNEYPFRKVMIVNARSKWEYAGWHIQTTVNCHHTRE
jgi:hypothetical protein